MLVVVVVVLVVVLVLVVVVVVLVPVCDLTWSQRHHTATSRPGH